MNDQADKKTRDIENDMLKKLKVIGVISALAGVALLVMKFAFAMDIDTVAVFMCFLAPLMIVALTKLNENKNMKS